MMAGNNPSSTSNPFGYTFPAYPTNDPPSGPPLLDQDESSTLQNFFADPDHYRGSEILPEHLLNNLTAGNDSTLSLLNPESQWLYQNDQNYAAPYAAQDQTYQAQNASYSQRGLEAPEDVLQLVGIPTNNTPVDVLNAASTLFLYRANNQGSEQNLPSTIFHPPPTHRPAPDHSNRSASFSYPSTQQYPPPNQHFRASLDNSMTNTHSHPQSHPHSHSSSSHQSSTPMYHFGSDNNFRQGGYAAPYEGLEDATAQTHIDFVRGMVHSSNGAMSSVENSLPHTPDLSRGEHNFYPSAMHAFTTLGDQTSITDIDKFKPKKRRKTVDAGDEGFVDRKLSTTSAAFNHSSPDGDNTVIEDSPDNDGEDNLAPTAKRRRASSGANGKAASLARKNLTEEQKRSNHIRSEQKRRNIIKQGYQDLNELVPNLKTGGFSKSAVLTETTRYLEEVQTGNIKVEELLRRRAAEKGLNFDDL